MNILMSHSYFLPLDPKEAANHKPYPPLAPLTVAAWIKERLNLEISFYDVMFDSDEKGLEQQIARRRPDIFILYDDDFNFLTKMCLENMRQAVFRAIKNRPASGIFIAHGSDASDQADAYLTAGFDVIIHRNAEAVLLKVLKTLKNNRNLADLQNQPSVSLKMAGRHIHNAPARQNLPVEETPPPRWDIIDLAPYRQTWKRHHGYFSLNMATAHGCPFGCNWCAKPLYGRTYQAVPAEQAAEQVRYLHRTLKADHLWMTDDLFALKPGWISDFADALERMNLRVPYKCLSRADLISNSFAAELSRSGCRELWMGVESGSQKILDAMDKGLRVEQVLPATQRLKRNGIRVGFFLQYGYPGEEMYDIGLTLALIRRCRPDAIGISVSYPLKGTPFYEKVLRQMGEQKNWKDSGDLALMYAGKYSPDFYRALHRYTHHYFGLVSAATPRPPVQWLRRIAAQHRHIPGLIRERLKMRKLIAAN